MNPHHEHRYQDDHPPTKDWIIVARPQPLSFQNHHTPLFLMAGAAFLESLFVPFILDLIVLGLVLRGTHLWKLVAVSIPASVAGTLVWYVLGLVWGPDALALANTAFALDPALVAGAQEAWANNWALALFGAALTPIPDPLAAAMAGATGLPVFPVLGVLVASHALRLVVMGAIVALARRLTRTTTTSTRGWITRLSLAASLLTGILLGGLVLARVLV